MNWWLISLSLTSEYFVGNQKTIYNYLMCKSIKLVDYFTRFTTEVSNDWKHSNFSVNQKIRGKNAHFEWSTSRAFLRCIKHVSCEKKAVQMLCAAVVCVCAPFHNDFIWLFDFLFHPIYVHVSLKRRIIACVSHLHLSVSSQIEIQFTQWSVLLRHSDLSRRFSFDQVLYAFSLNNEHNKALVYHPWAFFKSMDVCECGTIDKLRQSNAKHLLSIQISQIVAWTIFRIQPTTI